MAPSSMTSGGRGRKDETRQTQLAKALAHPLRMRLLRRLNEGVASPKELAEELGEPLPLVSYHIRILRELGCIELVRRVQRRGALEHFYRPLTRAHLTTEDWSSLPASVRSTLTATVIEETVMLAKASLDAGVMDARDDRHVSLTELELDEAGWAHLNERLDELLREATHLQARAMASSGSSERIRSALALAHFIRAPASDG